jgi:hypothetical protein
VPVGRRRISAKTPARPLRQIYQCHPRSRERRRPAPLGSPRDQRV